MKQERRQYLRAKVSWPVSIRTEKETLERVTYNISPIGAFICGLSLLELHEVVDMIISASDLQIEVKARVVWTSNQVPPEEYMPRGMGVEFVKISDEDQETISSFISDLSEAEAFTDAEVDKILEEEHLVQDEKEYKADKEDKSNLTFTPPKQCLRGHKHLSWSPGSDHVFCWDCNKEYAISECFNSEKPEILKETREQSGGE
jgi:hypothetical protein